MSSILIDVREPSEFSNFHLQGSINIPDNRVLFSDFDALRDIDIILICNTGVRAKAVARKLEAAGFDNVSVAQKQLKELSSDLLDINLQSNAKLLYWTVDRQFRLTLGIFLATYLVLMFFNIRGAIYIPMILATGLIVTSIIDKCYMRMAIGMLPFNRKRKNDI